MTYPPGLKLQKRVKDPVTGEVGIPPFVLYLPRNHVNRVGVMYLTALRVERSPHRDAVVAALYEEMRWLLSRDPSLGYNLPECHCPVEREAAMRPIVLALLTAKARGDTDYEHEYQTISMGIGRVSLGWQLYYQALCYISCRFPKNLTLQRKALHGLQCLLDGLFVTLPVSNLLVHPTTFQTVAVTHADDLLQTIKVLLKTPDCLPIHSTLVSFVSSIVNHTLYMTDEERLQWGPVSPPMTNMELMSKDGSLVPKRTQTHVEDLAAHLDTPYIRTPLVISPDESSDDIGAVGEFCLPYPRSSVPQDFQQHHYCTHTEDRPCTRRDYVRELEKEREMLQRCDRIRPLRANWMMSYCEGAYTSEDIQAEIGAFPRNLHPSDLQKTYETLERVKRTGLFLMKYHQLMIPRYPGVYTTMRSVGSACRRDSDGKVVFTAGYAERAPFSSLHERYESSTLAQDNANATFGDLNSRRPGILSSPSKGIKKGHYLLERSLIVRPVTLPSCLVTHTRCLYTCHTCVDQIVMHSHKLYALYDARLQLERAIADIDFDAHSFERQFGGFGFGDYLSATDNPVTVIHGRRVPIEKQAATVLTAIFHGAGLFEKQPREIAFARDLIVSTCASRAKAITYQVLRLRAPVQWVDAIASETVVPSAIGEPDGELGT
ncbi:hypothetical protein KIPB_000807 [Kipferlia bialata]|uniref:Uncharacterized protein n=1 Tax=Kipferlia bialata TaxID=797122 RepID=A0A9K3CMY0_9EUKA|nr:hypothetical protein KIPB_000807 [Kipferlia bialata]|eukprot:g807.t1